MSLDVLLAPSDFVAIHKSKRNTTALVAFALLLQRCCFRTRAPRRSLPRIGGVPWTPTLVLSLGKHTNLSEPTHAITLELEPLAERLNFVHGIGREQVIDRDVRRRH
jgi:hypothetical protein